MDSSTSLDGSLDAKASIFEEPGARIPHAGICAGAARATGRSTATNNPKVHPGLTLANAYHLERLLRVCGGERTNVARAIAGGRTSREGAGVVYFLQIPGGSGGMSAHSDVAGRGAARRLYRAA